MVVREAILDDLEVDGTPQNERVVVFATDGSVKVLTLETKVKV